MATQDHPEDPREVARALSYFNSDDREEWVRCCFAVKDALGEDGRSIWMQWSAQSPKFNERSAESTWRGAKPGGGVTAASLFGLARRRGYRRQDSGERPRNFRGDAEWRARQKQVEQEREQSEQKRQEYADRAALEAQAMLDSAKWDFHPYLTSKGFSRPGDKHNPGRKGFVLDGDLLIPMRSVRTGEVRAVQAIKPDGSRKFLPWRCRATGCVFAIGPRGRVAWWVEGYATGLAVRAGLDSISRQNDRVICCFSSGQLAKIPRMFPKMQSYVVADHDLWSCSNRECGYRWDESPPGKKCPECGRPATEPAGSKAAIATGLPWWEPPKPGTDAHDFMSRYGAVALGREIMAALEPYRDGVV